LRNEFWRLLPQDTHLFRRTDNFFEKAPISTVKMWKCRVNVAEKLGTEKRKTIGTDLNSHLQLQSHKEETNAIKMKKPTKHASVRIKTTTKNRSTKIVEKIEVNRKCQKRKMSDSVGIRDSVSENRKIREDGTRKIKTGKWKTMSEVKDRLRHKRKLNHEYIVLKKAAEKYRS